MSGTALLLALAAFASAQLGPPMKHPAHVRGVVVDDLGKPVAGADVECGYGRIDNAVHPFRPSARPRTDRQGQFSCGPVEAGDSAPLRIFSDDDAYVVLETRVSAPGLHKLTLMRRAVVRGNVSFGDGGVGAVYVDPLLADGGELPGDDTVDAIENASLATVDGGEFDLRVDPPTRLLRLHGDFVERVIPIEAKPGQVVQLGEVHVQRTAHAVATPPMHPPTSSRPARRP